MYRKSAAFVLVLLIAAGCSAGGENGSVSTIERPALLAAPPVPTVNAPPAYTAGTQLTLSWTSTPDPLLYQFEAARTNTAEEAAACGTEPPAGYYSVTVLAAIKQYIFTSLTDGQKYCYWVRSKNTQSEYSAWSPPVFSTQDNTKPTCAIETITGTPTTVYYNAAENKVYYNNQLGTGNIDAKVASVDGTSGVKYVEFLPIPAFTGTGQDTTAPYQSSSVNAWVFTLSTQTQSHTPTFNCSDNVKNISSGSFTLLRDIYAPSGGSISYPSGEQYAPYVTVSYNEGTDQDSGMGSIQVQRKEATYSLSSKTCGVYGSYLNAGAQTLGSVSWVDKNTAALKCYVYRLRAVDRVGNEAFYNSAQVYKRLPDTNIDKDKSVVQADPASITADGVSTSTLTVIPKDPSGKLLGPGHTASFAIIAGSGTLLGAVFDVGDGSYTQLLQSTVTLGSATVSATVNTILLNTTPTVAFIAGPVDKALSTIQAAPTQITADGESTSKITVKPVDANGNLLGTGHSVGINLVSGTGTIETTVKDNGDGTYEVTIKSPTKTGSGTFNAVVNTVELDNKATVTYVPGSRSKLGFSIQPPAVYKAGTVMASFTVEVQDLNGNVIPTDNSSEIIISLDTGTGVLKGALSGVVSSGAASFTTISYEKAETIKFKAVAVPPCTEAKSADITVTPSDVHHIVFTPSKTSTKVGTEASIQLGLHDVYGNPVPEARLVHLETGGSAFFNSTTLENNSGTGSALLDGTTLSTGKAVFGLKDTAAEIVNVKGAIDGVTGETHSSVQFTTEQADHVVLGANPLNLKAGSNSQIDVTVKDESDNDLGAMVSIRLKASGNGVFTDTSLENPAGLNTGTLSGEVPFSGKATATLTDVKSETVTVTPETVGLPEKTPNTGVSVKFKPADPAGTIQLTAIPPVIRADGRTKSVLTSGIIADQYGNTQTDGTLVAVTATCGTLEGLDGDGRAAVSAGAVSFALKAPALPCDADVAAASVEGTATGTKTVSIIDNPMPVANAGADTDAVGGDEVMLDGSGSYDPDGQPLTYKWTQKSGPAITFDNPAAQKPKFTAPPVTVQELIEVQLIVNDGYGDSEPNTVQVAIIPLESAKPKITSIPSLKGYTGTPYHYDADDAAESSGRPPFTWSKISGPDEFSINPATGKVTWIPVYYGPFNGISIKVSNKYGFDEQTFGVEVDKGVPPSPPVAVMKVDRTSGDIPLAVSFDSSESSTGKGARIVSFQWDFGDFGTYIGGETQVKHTYLRAGAYIATLTVTDDYSQTGTVSKAITATKPGRQPPTAKIVANPESGAVPLDVAFSCDCTSPNTLEYFWRFGSGEISIEEAPSYTFGEPGNWPVILVVNDQYGLGAVDKKFISVKSGEKVPPSVRVTANNGMGEAPLEVRFKAVVAPGTGAVSSRRWYVDGVEDWTDTTLTKTFGEAGVHYVLFKAVDEFGLAGADAVVISVTKGGMLPAQIYTIPSTEAAVGFEYSYEPRATGDRPFYWSITRGPSTVVEAPKGMTVDNGTGMVRWVPPAGTPTAVEVILSATNAAGTAFQKWEVNVTGGSTAKDGGRDAGADGGDGEPGAACSCSAVSIGGTDTGGLMPTSALALLALLIAVLKSVRGTHTGRT